MVEYRLLPSGYCDYVQKIFEQSNTTGFPEHKAIVENLPFVF